MKLDYVLTKLDYDVRMVFYEQFYNHYGYWKRMFLDFFIWFDIYFSL